MSFRKAAEAQQRLELELNEERAAALRRIAQTLESFLEQLSVLREQIGTVHWSDPSPDLARFRELRRLAVRQRWYLEVQREALGLRPDHRLDEFYRIPRPM